MKVKYLMILLISFVIGTAYGQTNSETITRSLEVKSKSIEFWFCVCNINGNVQVEAYDGNMIEVTAEKTVNGRSDEDINLGMEELQLRVSENEDYIRVSMETPIQRIAEKQDPLRCGWDWNERADARKYGYTIDYKVKVPRGISVKLSTVNKGEVVAKGVTGNVYASNVNGDVTLKEIQGDTKASTVNGKVEVSYVDMPKEFASFETVNGDIEIHIPEGGNGVFKFQSQWGKIYSELDFSAKLAPKVVKTSAGKGTKYKVSNSNSYQLGKTGGADFEFETLNGNVYLKRKK